MQKNVCCYLIKLFYFSLHWFIARKKRMKQQKKRKMWVREIALGTRLHIVIQTPPRSGSNYFNHEKIQSIGLLVVCNARYKFTLVDVGQAGGQSDGGVYENNNLSSVNDENLLNVLLHQMICHLMENIIHMFLWLTMPFK